MTARPSDLSERIPRPEQTPHALREAVTLLVPERLPEMQQSQDAAMVSALQQQSIVPLRAWLLTWARDIEIARRPDLATRQRDAVARMHSEDSSEADVQRAVDDLSVVLDEALTARAGKGP